MVHKMFHIKGMECPNCALFVEKIDEDLPGIEMVFANYQNGQMEVEYDETQVSEAQIFLAVEKRGYQALQE